MIFGFDSLAFIELLLTIARLLFSALLQNAVRSTTRPKRTVIIRSLFARLTRLKRKKT